MRKREYEKQREERKYKDRRLYSTRPKMSYTTKEEAEKRNSLHEIKGRNRNYVVQKNGIHPKGRPNLLKALPKSLQATLGRER